MNVLLLCEALAQKIVERMDIPNPSEVDFASQPGFDSLIESLDIDQEDLTELAKIGNKNLP
jgi:hypothetical protein